MPKTDTPPDVRLPQLREKYGLGDGAKYEPKGDCRFCSGTGERPVRDHSTKTETFCICLFVDHSVSDEAGAALGRVAREELGR